MSVIVIATTAGMTADQYDQITQKQSLGGDLPAGCSAHIAGPSPDGWRVVSVWDSAESAGAFMKESVQPFQAELGIAASSTPPVIYPLHVLMK